MYKFICTLGLLMALLTWSASAQALSCSVQYKAKRIVEERHWHGTIEKPEFRKATANGRGATLDQCADNALKSTRQAGWTITWQQVNRR